MSHSQLYSQGLEQCVRITQLTAVGPGWCGLFSLSSEQLSTYSCLNPSSELGGLWVSLLEANHSPRKMWVLWWTRGLAPGQGEAVRGQGRVWTEAPPPRPNALPPRVAQPHMDIIVPVTAFGASKYRAWLEPGSQVTEGGHARTQGPRSQLPEKRGR